MQKRSSNLRHGLVGAVSVIMVLGALVILVLFLANRATTQAKSTGAIITDANQEPGPPASDEYITVHAQDFGIWSYGATRSAIESLHATVSYKHDTVHDLLAYAEANRGLLADVEGIGGRVEVAITFVYPVEVDWYRQFAREHSFQATSTQIQVGAPGTSGTATMSISGTADDPLPQENIDNVAMGFFSDSIGGIFGAYGTIDAVRIAGVLTDRGVYC